MEETIRQQQQEHNKDMKKKGLKYQREKSNLVRDTVQRKMCVVVFGVKEKDIPMKIASEK